MLIRCVLLGRLGTFQSSSACLHQIQAELESDSAGGASDSPVPFLLFRLVSSLARVSVLVAYHRQMGCRCIEQGPD